MTVWTFLAAWAALSVVLAPIVGRMLRRARERHEQWEDVHVAADAHQRRERANQHTGGGQ